MNTEYRTQIVKTQKTVWEIITPDYGEFSANVSETKLLQKRVDRNTAGLGEYVDKLMTDRLAYDLLRNHAWNDGSITLYESFFVIAVNRNGRYLGHKKISQGGVSGTVADMKLIFNYAILIQASGIILAHNHPSGNLTPSESDRQLTRKAVEGGRFLEIEVFDHLIITEGNYYSFRENNLI